jgi:hypothetical protein
MKKIAAILALGAAFAAGPAYAGPMDYAYQNTVVVTYANGAAARYHFNADGTFHAMLPDGQHASGAYELAGDQICLTPTGGQRACTAAAPDKAVGDSWTQTGTDGSSITVSVVAGR